MGRRISVERKDLEATLEVHNIGGIDETSVVFEPDVTILTARNATNRTSLLKAIMASLGSEDVSVKTDADEAHVELELGDEIYTQTFEKRNGEIHTNGEPYLEDSTLADLFAFLLESNEARRAVVRDADLRDIIMQPIDTDEIQAEINRRVETRREISSELEELDDLKNRLPSLEEEKTQLEERIEDKKAELDEVEAEIEAADADVEEGREEQAELEEKLEELRDKLSDLEDVRYDLETEQDSPKSHHAEKRETQTEYDDLPETPAGDLEELESRID